MAIREIDMISGGASHVPPTATQMSPCEAALVDADLPQRGYRWGPRREKATTMKAQITRTYSTAAYRIRSVMPAWLASRVPEARAPRSERLTGCPRARARRGSGRADEVGRDLARAWARAKRRAPATAATST